ncbi:ATP-grasp domain-containing protein [Thalassolituus sp. UBA2590]|uniref:ATP-grasp domain-containing protein n=1 Tax=Thalassolituus sp. UBA2590 TaxID=1947663 RepID=UPI002649EF14|nr:hypothetical protein [Thalassolituus sp. UBA2590]|tara:strand:- start:165 stop:1037 length:873 start_codon:yes stop_codon:yes gene_type:complete
MTQRLIIISDEPEEDLTEQLVAAAHAHELKPIIIEPALFDHVEPPVLNHGDLLYRVAITHESCVIEQQLVHPGVATCYRDALGAFLIWDNQTLFLARNGIETPRTFHAMTTDREELKRRVEALGGLPVIFKVPGKSLGVGVVRVDNWPTFYSVADALESAHGQYVHLMACVEPAEHWRMLVVNGEVAAAYQNIPQEGDFRTCVDEDKKECFTTPPPESAKQLAIDACAVLGLEFGGVDVLVHTSGREYVLEVNFPCYFAHPKHAIDLDVADHLVRHLKQKGQRLKEQLAG